MKKRILHLLKRGLEQFGRILLHPKETIVRFRFLVAMSRKCRQIGMRDTRLFNASGASSFSYSTPYDLLQLILHINQFPTICDICSTSSCDIQINGQSTRLESNVFNNPEYHDCAGYRILYAKTGSWGNTHKAIAARVLVNNASIDLAVMVSDAFCFQNIFGIVRELVDLAAGNKLLEQQYLPALIRNGGGYCALYNNTIFQHKARKRFLLASVSKLVTAICVLENSQECQLVIRKLDVLSSDGVQLKESDNVSQGDALKLMLIESSNTAAEALGRTCGEQILKRRNRYLT